MLATAAVAAVAAFFATGVLVVLLPRWGVVDVPNHRSSHIRARAARRRPGGHRGRSGRAGGRASRCGAGGRLGGRPGAGRRWIRRRPPLIVGGPAPRRTARRVSGGRCSPRPRAGSRRCRSRGGRHPATAVAQRLRQRLQLHGRQQRARRTQRRGRRRVLRRDRRRRGRRRPVGGRQPAARSVPGVPAVELSPSPHLPRRRRQLLDRVHDRVARPWSGCSAPASRCGAWRQQCW